ncbi:amine oxidase catalytic domain-containing protein [Mycena alexandri]|uniref:Amine oxidase n=1 Tax=Mycena alexandri TaxID=1745969 RepID=A0AAD6WYI7_9AGAR|nr:amine oxidase catalytic domain-containing protein [Mycena alexandri]
MAAAAGDISDSTMSVLPTKEDRSPSFKPNEPPSTSKTRRLAIFVALTSAAAFLLLAPVSRRSLVDNNSTFIGAGHSIPGFCADISPILATAPRDNVWKNFDVQEAVVIRQWLWEYKDLDGHGFNFTDELAATDLDNSISLIQNFPPPKAEVLEYFDNNATSPERFAKNATYLQDFILQMLTPLRNATQDLLGGVVHGSRPASGEDVEEPDLVFGGSTPFSYDGSFRPRDMYFYIDMTSMKASEWYLIRMVYNRQSAALGTLPTFLPADEEFWAGRARRGQKRDLDERAGPRQVSFNGPRYRVDKDNQWVSWMGWSFYLSFARDMGMSLWDVRFRGERILYEVSPQEALAVYSGSDPSQGSTAIKGYELLVRTISTVGNYDYLFDYTFQLDGTMEVRISASGYMQGAWWDDTEESIRDQDPGIHTVMGSIHDHVINYKFDFDIAGTRNSLMAISLENEVVEQPWFDDDWGQEHQQKIVKKMIRNESDALLDYPKNYEGVYAIVNEEELNRWGYPRGYAIHPGVSPIHMTNLDSKRTKNNVNFAKHHLAVSRRKDSEPTSSSMWNINLPGAPPVDFYKFFDGESLEQEDLTAWVNLGMHHIPRAEDSPMTLTNLATSSVLLTPFNFNDWDPAMESMNAIVISVPEPGDSWTADENGVEIEYCLPPRVAKFNYPGTSTFEKDGTPGKPLRVHEMRQQAESYHAIFAASEL